MFETDLNGDLAQGCAIGQVTIAFEAWPRTFFDIGSFLHQRLCDSATEENISTVNSHFSE